MGDEVKDAAIEPDVPLSAPTRADPEATVDVPAAAVAALDIAPAPENATPPALDTAQQRAVATVQVEQNPGATPGQIVAAMVTSGALHPADEERMYHRVRREQLDAQRRRRVQ